MEDKIKNWERMIAFKKLDIKVLRKDIRSRKNEIRRLEALISRANSHATRATA